MEKVKLTYITSLHLMPNTGQIDLFSPHENIHFIWTQVILQTTGMVVPHHTLLQEVWMEISIHLHGLETILWPLRVIYMEEKRH